MNMKKYILAIAIVASLAGCGPNTRRDDAYNRWYHVRARMLHGLASEHLKIGQLDKAHNKASEALVLDAKFLPAGILLAKVDIEQGRYKQAVVTLEKFRPDHPENAEIVYLTAVANEKCGNLAEALEGYKKAHAMDDSDFSSITAAGEVLVAMGRLKEAQVFVTGYLGAAENEPALFELAGRLALMHRQWDEAVKNFRRARDVDYKNRRYQEALARAEFMAGKYAQTIETLKELSISEDYTTPAWVHSMLGDCYMSLDQPAKARDEYYVVRRMKGKDPQTWVDIAKAALALNDAPRAVLSAREAINLDPSCQDAWVVLGYGLLRQKQNEAAVENLTRAVKRHPRNATLYCLLGRAHQACGDKTKARACYNEALVLESQFELARALLATTENGLKR